jgi:hypothetical protein
MKPACLVADCGRAFYQLGLCSGHYQQFYHFGKILPRPIRANTRYRGASCDVETCTRKATDKGYCKAHYDRLRHYGSLMPEKPIRVLRPRRYAA